MRAEIKAAKSCHCSLAKDRTRRSNSTDAWIAGDPLCWGVRDENLGKSGGEAVSQGKDLGWACPFS